MTTSLVIEAVTPAITSGADDPWVTASFTPPNNSLLVVAISADWFGGTPTLTPVSTGLTFVSKVRNGALNQGVAEIFTAEVGASGGSARTVSVTTSLAGVQPGTVKVWVVSGQHATLYVNATAGATGSTVNDLNGQITTTVDGCQVFGVGGDWNNLGAAISYDTFENATPGGVAPVMVQKSTETAEAGVEDINFNASTLTSAPMWSWSAIAIRPTTYTKPAIYKRPLRARVQNLTSQTSTAVALTSAGTIQVGSYLIASVALDDPRTDTPGAAVTLTVTDPRSNTWTILGPSLRNAGTANSGTAAYLAYAKVVNAYTAGDSLTFNYAGTGNSVPAKAITVEEWAGIDATTPVAVSAVTAGAASTTPSASISPLAADQLVYGVLAYEAADNVAYTPDSDTTNGTWARQAAIGTTSGTSASNQVVRTATKLVSASGSQTWNTTIATNDWAELLVVFAPAASSTPKTGSDGGSVAVAETSAIAASSNVTDGGSIAAADSSAILKTIPVTDGGSISVDDAATIFKTIVAADGGSIAVADVSAVTGSNAVVASDGGSIAIDDSSALFKTIAATDTASISVSETTAKFNDQPGADGGSIAVAEVAGIVISGTLLKTAVDAAQISVSDVSSVNVSSASADAGALSVTESVAVATSSGATDTSAITISDSSHILKTMVSADVAAISVDDQATVVKNVALSASDTLTIGVTETTNVKNSAPVVKVYAGGVWVTGTLHIYVNGAWVIPTIRIRRSNTWL